MKKHYNYFVIVDGSAIEVGPKYETESEAQKDLCSYQKLLSGCVIEERKDK